MPMKGEIMKGMIKSSVIMFMAAMLVLASCDNTTGAGGDMEPDPGATGGGSINGTDNKISGGGLSFINN